MQKELPSLARVRTFPFMDDDSLVMMVLRGEKGFLDAEGGEESEKYKLIDVVMEVMDVVGKYVVFTERDREYVRGWHEEWLRLW